MKHRCFFSFSNMFVFVMAAILLFLFCKGWMDMHDYLSVVDQPEISLSWTQLPYYTLRTTIRLLIGLIYSFIFAIIFGAFSAKYKAIARVVLPFVNFMESVPLVGFLTFTTLYFLEFYPNSVMGLECAAIFGVFTSQAWNMCLVVYQTLRIVPPEIQEASLMFHYSAWQRFWIVEFPYCIPGLIWNTMVSQSAAWFAVVATEAIPVKERSIALPGVGSYIQEAISQQNYFAIVCSVIAIIISIILLDQIFFKPLVQFSKKFKFEDGFFYEKNQNLFYEILKDSYLIKIIINVKKYLFYFFVYEIIIFFRKNFNYHIYIKKKICKIFSIIWYFLIIISFIYGLRKLFIFIPKDEIMDMPYLMLLTCLRVCAAMILSILFFVPLGIWIGLSSKRVKIFQPLVQIFAALPPNILYPIFTFFLILAHQDLSFWSVVLIMLGTQWYVLFNVIAGTISIPTQMREMTNLFQVKGFLWWKKFMIPALFPYIVTGIISAAGGAWNAAITAEFLEWGNNTLKAEGVGSYVSLATKNNQVPQAALGCATLCFMVGLCVVFIWTPIYKIAENRFKIS